MAAILKLYRLQFLLSYSTSYFKFRWLEYARRSKINHNQKFDILKQYKG